MIVFPEENGFEELDIVKWLEKYWQQDAGRKLKTCGYWERNGDIYCTPGGFGNGEPVIWRFNPSYYDF